MQPSFESRKRAWEVLREHEKHVAPLFFEDITCQEPRLGITSQTYFGSTGVNNIQEETLTYLTYSQQSKSLIYDVCYLQCIPTVGCFSKTKGQRDVSNVSRQNLFDEYPIPLPQSQTWSSSQRLMGTRRQGSQYLENSDT